MNGALKSIGYHVTSIHRSSNMIQTVKKADVIIVGGGNTWQLTKQLHANKLMKEISRKVKNGTPYIG
ncbi:hypothetical protein FACS1894218_0400 [Bacilli bacterium]|nr:hypothetical protein FACS1894218_0400 [Bacilli bacterium]